MESYEMIVGNGVKRIKAHRQVHGNIVATISYRNCFVGQVRLRLLWDLIKSFCCV